MIIFRNLQAKNIGLIEVGGIIETELKTNK